MHPGTRPPSGPSVLWFRLQITLDISGSVAQLISSPDEQGEVAPGLCEQESEETPNALSLVLAQGRRRMQGLDHDYYSRYYYYDYYQCILVLHR